MEITQQFNKENPTLVQAFSNERSIIQLLNYKQKDFDGKYQSQKQISNIREQTINSYVQDYLQFLDKVESQLKNKQCGYNIKQSLQNIIGCRKIINDYFQYEVTKFKLCNRQYISQRVLSGQCGEQLKEDYFNQTLINSYIFLNYHSKFMNHIKSIYPNISFISNKEKANYLKQITQQKLTSNQNKIINKDQLIRKNSYFQRKLISQYLKIKQKDGKNVILGGGCKQSKLYIENPQKILFNLKKIPLDKKFLEDFNYYTNKQNIEENINYEKQGAMQMEIFQQCISLREIHIRKDIQAYKPKLLEIIEVYLIYVLTGYSQKEVLKQKEIDKLGQYILDMKQSFDMEAQDQPCLDLCFYFDVLHKFNSNRVGKDEQNKNLFSKLTELLLKLIQLGIGGVQMAGGNFMPAIKLALEGTNNLIELFQKSKTNQIFTYFLDIWAKKLDKFQDRIWQLTVVEELEFYINLFIDLCNNEESQSEVILLSLIKIDYFFSKALEDDQSLKSLELVRQQFPLSSDLIKKFLLRLIQKGRAKSILDGIKKNLILLTVSNPIYRFLSISILLKYNEIIQDENDYLDYKEYIMLYLSYKYLCEKKKSVKLAYETNKQFIEKFNKKIEDQEFQKKITELSKQRQQDLQLVLCLESYENKIDNSDDIHRMIANNLIEKWERDVRKRQQENIDQKDDVLLEVKDLYIQQQITYLAGKQLFQDKIYSNLQISMVNKDNQESQQTNALNQIIDKFLKKGIKTQNKLNQMKESAQNINETQNSCRILGILAEGGTGKSMLIKKIETHLIENPNINSSNEEDEEQFIPLLIKCNSLDPVWPSIQQYLIQMGIDLKQIEILQNSDRTKVILLDGYDEFTGEYFRVYQDLNLQSWKNTLVIVSSRREKLELSDACANFSIDNEQGQRDESSFCIVRLQEFNKQDIQDYCKRYFKQYRTKNEQFDEQQFQKDLSVIDNCMKNYQLENLLYLPINLYLFTRMIVEVKDEQEIQQIQQSVSDQIGIQEIFFKEQFKREAKDFVFNQMNDQLKNQEIYDLIINSYFEYFQTIAIQMFKNKGKESINNFLQIQKDKIQFNLSNIFKKILSEKQQKSLLEKIIHYINSKIITRAQDVNMNSKVNKDVKNIFIEFKHKSLFEYFVARAMKYDFDIHGDLIYKLPMESLKSFNINQKSIMNKGQNQSEQQILKKLYKLMKNEIESNEFYLNYHDNNIENNNRYIQYLKMSKISNINDTSQIDTGASNLISALLISKFSYQKLNLSLKSFSKAYICIPKCININFDRCNLSQAYLKNTLINYDSCNTQQASFEAYKQVFDTQSVYSFNQVISGKNDILYTISQSGYINSFQYSNQIIQLRLSKQLSQTPLIKIILITDNNLLVSSQYTLLLINPINFDISETYKFLNPISEIILQKDNIIVSLQNKNVFHGNIQKGFQQLNIQGKGIAYNSINSILITCKNKILSLWDVNKNFEQIKTFEAHSEEIEIAAFSADEKLLATGSQDNTCKLWNAEKGYELIHTIEGHYSYLTAISFSATGKYLITGSSDNSFKIINIQKDFEVVNTIFSHNNNINSVSFSQNDKYLITGSENVVKIWNTEQDFELINSIQGQASNVFQSLFSENGKYLATCSSGSSCFIWNAEKNFELIKVLSGHTSSINCVYFSQNSKFLATGSSDTTCKIWSVEQNFTLINTIEGEPMNKINSLAFSENGKYLITTSNSKDFKVFNVNKDFELIKSVQGHHNYINSVAFTRDNKYLATGSIDKTCKIWSVEKDFELLVTIEGHTGNIHSVAFSADAKYLATASSDRSCKIWNTEKSFQLITTVQGHTNKINSVAFSLDGKYMATCSADKTCKMWNVERGFELINTIYNHTDNVNQVSFSPNSQYLATSSFDCSCRVWNIEKGFEHINSVSNHTGGINQVTFSEDSKYLVTGSNDNTFKIWNTDKGFELIKSIQGHISNVETVAFSSNKKFLATGSYDTTCKIWNTEKGFELLNTIQAHTQQINSIVFSADSKFLATCSNDYYCKIWSTENNFQLVKPLQGHSLIQSISFSKDNKYFATGYGDGTCQIWNTEKEFELINTLKDHIDRINSNSFSQDGVYFATGCQDSTCVIRDVKKNFIVLNTIKQDQGIYSIAFSPDSIYLATVSLDKTCKIWNSKKGFEMVYSFQCHDRNINSVTFSSNGKYLATGSFDNTSKIWNAESGFDILNTIQNHASNIQFINSSANKQYISVGYEDKVYKIFEFNKVQKLQEKQKLENVNQVCFSKDSQQIYVELVDQKKIIYNLQSLEVVKEKTQNDYSQFELKQQMDTNKIYQLQKINIFENMYCL